VALPPVVAARQAAHGRQIHVAACAPSAPFAAEVEQKSSRHRGRDIAGRFVRVGEEKRRAQRANVGNRIRPQPRSSMWIFILSRELWTSFGSVMAVSLAWESQRVACSPDLLDTIEIPRDDVRSGWKPAPPRCPSLAPAPACRASGFVQHPYIGAFDSVEGKMVL